MGNHSNAVRGPDVEEFYTDLIRELQEGLGVLIEEFRRIT